MVLLGYPIDQFSQITRQIIYIDLMFILNNKSINKLV